MAILSNIIGGLKKGVGALATSLETSKSALDKLAKKQKAANAADEAELTRHLATQKRLIDETRKHAAAGTTMSSKDAARHAAELKTTTQMQRDVERSLSLQRTIDARETGQATISAGRGWKVLNTVMQAGNAAVAIARVGGLNYADAAIKAARGTHLAGASMDGFMWSGIKLNEQLGLGADESSQLVVGLSQIGFAANKQLGDLDGLALGIGSVGRISGVGSAAVLEFYDAQLRVAGASSNGAAAIANLSVEAQKAGLTGKEAFEEMTKHADMELGMDDAAKHEYMRRMLSAAATMKAAGINMKDAAPKKEGTDRMIRDAGLSSLSGNMFSADEIARKRTNIENGGEGAIQDRIDIAKAQSTSIRRLGGAASPEEWNKAQAAAAAGGSNSKAAIDFENMKKKTEQAIKVANEATGDAIGPGTVAEIMARLEKENRLSTAPKREVKAGSMEDTKKAATSIQAQTTDEWKEGLKAKAARAVQGGIDLLPGGQDAKRATVAGIEALKETASAVVGPLLALKDAALEAAKALGWRVAASAAASAGGAAAGGAAGGAAAAAAPAAAAAAGVLLPAIAVVATAAAGAYVGTKLYDNTKAGKAVGDWLADPTGRDRAQQQRTLDAAAMPIPGMGGPADNAPGAGARNDARMKAKREAKAAKAAELDQYIDDFWNDSPDSMSLQTPRSAAIDETSYGDGTPQSIDPEQHERLLAQGNTVAARQLDSLAATRDLNEQMLAAILNLGTDGFSPLLSGGSRV